MRAGKTLSGLRVVREAEARGEQVAVVRPGEKRQTITFREAYAAGLAAWERRVLRLPEPQPRDERSDEQAEDA